MSLIKRYSNRKLYDTETRQYVTLEEIRARVENGEEIRIIDHDTDEDLTAATLSQVIFEQGKASGSRLPLPLLTHLIRAGEERIQGLQEGISAFIHPDEYVAREISRRLDKLVLGEVLSIDEAERILDLLLSVTPAEVESENEVKVKITLLQDLISRVEEIEKEMEKHQRKAES